MGWIWVFVIGFGFLGVGMTYAVVKGWREDKGK